jgi:hypothetical protein
MTETNSGGDAGIQFPFDNYSGPPRDGQVSILTPLPLAATLSKNNASGEEKLARDRQKVIFLILKMPVLTVYRNIANASIKPVAFLLFCRIKHYI